MKERWEARREGMLIRKKEKIVTTSNGLLLRIPAEKSFVKPPPELVPVSDEKHWTGGDLLREVYRYYRSRDPVSVQRITVGGIGGADFWAIVVGRNYYVTISKSPRGLEGDHIGMLFYTNSFKQNFAIASFTMTGHFTKLGREGIEALVSKTIRYHRFFQSPEAKKQVIPL